MSNPQNPKRDAKENILTGCLQQAEVFSKIFAAIVIPFLLAYLANNYTAAIKEREIQGKFVELAISILKEKPSEDNRSLREWSVQVIDKYSGVPLSAKARDDLITRVPISNVNCAQLIPERHDPTFGSPWVFTAIGEDRVITIWSTHKTTNLPVHRLFLPAGQSASFMSGGGTVYSDPPGCSGTAKWLYDNYNSLKPITLEQYQEYIDKGIMP